MSDAPVSGSGGAPAPVVLPFATNGYRRKLFPGRGVAVYYDHHQANEWREHAHDQTQGAIVLNRVKVLVNWRTTGEIWHQQELPGPAAWLIPAGMPHALVCPDQTEMVTLFMEPFFVLESLGRLVEECAFAPLAQLASRDQVIGQLAKTFRNLCADQQPAPALYVEGVGTVISAHVLRAMFGLTSAGARRGGLPPEALRRVMRHIDEHLDQAIRLDQLSQVAGVCRSRFTRAFKTSLSLSAHAYIVRRRVERALELLHKTEMKEIDIAHACGFSDDTLMARWFRRVLECTPRQARANRPA